MGLSLRGTGIRWALLGLLIVRTGAACNFITGAEDLVLVPYDDEDGGADPGTTTSPPDGTGAGPSHTTTSSNDTTSDTDTGSGTTTNTPTTTTTTTETPMPVDCEYPTGPYGTNIGNKINGAWAWQGYTENSASLTNVSIQDYFDCDGSKGIHAILVITSAQWCSACQSEAEDLPSHFATFDAKGIRVITMMVEDNYGAPADPGVAKSWKDYFGLDGITVVADPNFSFDTSSLPTSWIVDPRTMKVVDREEGYSGDYTPLINLATSNGG